jgi:hypothetical protein
VYEVGLKNPKAPVRAIEGVAENQKSESAGSDTRHRWNVLAEKDPARMPSKAKERAERLFRQQQKAPKALADYRAKQEAFNRQATSRAFGTRSDTWEAQTGSKKSYEELSLPPQEGAVKIKKSELHRQRHGQSRERFESNADDLVPYHQ